MTLVFGYSVQPNNISLIVDDCLDAVARSPELEFDSMFIERAGADDWEWDVDRLQFLERGFAHKKGGLIRGVCGAIDGIAIQMTCPSRHDTRNPERGTTGRATTQSCASCV